MDRSLPIQESGNKKLGKFRTSARAAAKTDPMTINNMTCMAAKIPQLQVPASQLLPSLSIHHANHRPVGTTLTFKLYPLLSAGFSVK